MRLLRLGSLGEVVSPHRDGRRRRLRWTLSSRQSREGDGEVADAPAALRPLRLAQGRARCTHHAHSRGRADHRARHLTYLRVSAEGSRIPSADSSGECPGRRDQ